jgi:putative ABC transport system permease protein
MQDLRYALRTLRRSPGFTAVAVLSLALGIGANTAIFTLVDHVLIRSLPVREPARLVELLHRFPGEPALNGYGMRAYRFFEEHNHVFDGIVGMGNPGNWPPWSFAVKADGAASEWVAGVYVTGNYFDVLGIQPALGRLVMPADSAPGNPGKVAVVSYRYWTERFHGDRSLPGRRIVVDDEPATVVGVAPPGFAGLHIEKPEDIWLTWASDKRAGGVALVGRLKPGVSLERARAEMTVLWEQSQVLNGGQRNEFMKATHFELAAAAHGLTGVPSGGGLSSIHEAYGRPLAVLMAVVGVLLLVACTNLASLLLARAAGRQREMAVRVSLGATRARLARQSLTEALLLSGAGALPGFALAWLGTAGLLRTLASGRDPIDMRIAPDGRILLFTVAVALLTGVLFGLAPALRASATAPADALRSGNRASETRLQRLFGKGLVAAQVAFSLLLLCAAGVFVAHLSNLYAGLGFQRDHVLLVTLDSARRDNAHPQPPATYRLVLERLAAIPGVRSATLSGVTPILGAGANRDATVEGYQPAPGELRYLMINWVAPRYFETLGQPLLLGRDFTFEDAGRPRVAIVNETLAHHYFAAGSPLGKHVLFDRDTEPYEIVGVAADAKYRDTNEPAASTVYLNAFQQRRQYGRFSLRTSVPPAGAAAAARRVIAELLPNDPVVTVTTLADQVDASIVPERMVVNVSTLFAALGALLAAIGIYGLLAYTVARRVNEIGIRMALGATARNVTALVLRDALSMVFAGLALGIPLSLAAHRLAAGLVAGINVDLAPVLAAGAGVMIAVALVAAWLPARRAARVDPMEALRTE